MEVLVAGLAPWAFWAAVAITGFSGFVKGAVGFAMPMIMISAFSSFLPPEVALAGLILPTLVTNISQAFRQGAAAALASLRKYWRMITATVVFIVISAQFVRAIPQDLFLLLLGLPITGFAALQLAGRRLALKLEHQNRAEWGLGIIGGLYG
ncbi:MAG TPA: TSUP family transporter, partial [Paracoccaceae bacterium]